MSSFREPGGARRESREQRDLRRQYRTIGIGAIAAALTVKDAGADKDKKKEGNRSDAGNEWYRYSESTAA